jgi:DNA-binding transcriptional MerR regulator
MNSAMIDSNQNTSSLKSESAFRTISEVAEDLGVQQHVLRFWESKFSQVKPMKRGGGRRYYRPEDVALLKKIHHLLYAEGYTIKGVQKLLKGISKVQVLAEQKSSQNAEKSSQVFGANLPRVEGMEIQTSSSSVSRPDDGHIVATETESDYVLVLKSVLDELMDMREQVGTLLAEKDNQAA